MSLVELLVGLAVASIVAAIVMTALSMTGLAVARQRAAMRTDDAVWLAHAAIANDLRASTSWKGCIEARGCTGQTAHVGTPALVLGMAEWLVDGGLLRCKLGKPCDTYLEGISAVKFVAEIENGDGSIRRSDFAQVHGNKVRALEVELRTTDGRRYKRTTGAHERRQVTAGETSPVAAEPAVEPLDQSEEPTHAP